MEWIYDVTHPFYNEERAKWLRRQRAAAILSAPQWMREWAAYNSAMRDAGLTT